MKRVFLDTNVIMDFLSDRRPFSFDAGKILSLSDKGEVRIYISALTLAICYYLLKKSYSHESIIKKMHELSELVEIVDLKKEHLYASFESGFKDFEDSLQNESAKCISGLKIIITRNPDDFKMSHLEIMTPDKYLKKWISG